MADIVSRKDGEAGNMNDPSFEAMVIRANKACEGAKKYVSVFGQPEEEELDEDGNPKPKVKVKRNALPPDTDDELIYATISEV